MNEAMKRADEELRHAAEHGLFRRCMQEDAVDDLKVAIGLIDHTVGELERKTNEILERVEQKVDVIAKTIEESNLMVKVTSNGISAQVRLEDIIQFFLDRPIAQLKKAETILSRIVASSKDIVWIFGAILVIYYTFSSIMHLPRP